jgi:hypothetical protein
VGDEYDAECLECDKRKVVVRDGRSRASWTTERLAPNFARTRRPSGDGGVVIHRAFKIMKDWQRGQGTRQRQGRRGSESGKGLAKCRH